MRSALYEGATWHVRPGPVKHRFRTAMAMIYLDLDEIEEVLSSHPLSSTAPWTPLRYRRAYYLGPPKEPLADSVRRTVEQELGWAPARVGLLTHLRTWGCCFNPISIYYCFRSDVALGAALAEVTNTPWKQRHTYLLPADAEGRIEVVLPKELHVSPFMPMDQRYRMTVSPPGPLIDLRIIVMDADRPALVTGARLARREMCGRTLTRLLVRYPFMTARVSLRIHAEALRLALKRAPFHRHPRTRQSGGVSPSRFRSRLQLPRALEASSTPEGPPSVGCGRSHARSSKAGR